MLLLSCAFGRCVRCNCMCGSMHTMPGILNLYLHSHWMTEKCVLGEESASAYCSSADEGLVKCRQNEICCRPCLGKPLLLVEVGVQLAL